MANTEFEHIATEIVQTQSFEYTNFLRAISHIDILIDDKKHYLEYDRFTMYQYNSDLPPDEQAKLYSLVKDKLADRLNADQKSVYMNIGRCCGLPSAPNWNMSR